MKKSFISLIDKADPKTLETFFERVEPEKLPDETEKKLTARVVGTTKTRAKMTTTNSFSISTI